MLYDKQPSNEMLKKLTIACAPYFSTINNVQKIISLLETLPFNYRTFQWASDNFDLTYQAKWVPNTMPTLIFSGDQDSLTPLRLFSNSADFQRENILIREIQNSAHFPWLDNPERVKQVFEEYLFTYFD